MNDKGKLIMNSNLAVYLLQKGFRIIDLKANRTDRKRTVFIFQVEEGLAEAITEYTNLTKDEKRKLNKED